MNKPEIKIGVKVQGGFGTVLVRANFLHCLYEYIDDADLKIYACGHISPKINHAIFEDQPSIAWYSGEKNWNTLKANNDKSKEFALLFELDIYPKIVYVSDKVSNSPKLAKLVEDWKAFRKDPANDLYYKKLRNSKPYEYSKLINLGRHIMNSADITGDLQVGREYRMPVRIFIDEDQALKGFGLYGKKYITLQRGINPKLGTNENNKLWPLAYFNELIAKIKAEFPEYTIVQLGESAEHCATLENVDVNLLGKTTWDDIKILLKHSTLHIDGECGMVHLRKALHAGPSLVFFGPTPIDFFGYNGNFNLHTGVCRHWCAELRDDWEYHCLKDLDKAPCMYSITPDMAMDSIRDYLSAGDVSTVWNYVPEKKGAERLIEEYGEKISQDYIENYLHTMEIYDYEIKEIPVSELLVSVYNGRNWEWLPLEECPAYRYLSGEEDAYRKNMEQRQSLENNIHSCERFDELIKTIEENGLTPEPMVLVSSSMKVKDGQHRAAIWMHKYGKDSTIPVLMLYMRE